MKQEHKIVNLNLIKPDPKQPRKFIDEKSIEELAISIKNEGLINSIEVDPSYVIITGERRWRAAKKAGLKEIPVKILTGITPNERFIRQVQENVHQNTMTPLDTAEALEKIREIVASSAAELARDKFHVTENFQKGIKEVHDLLGIPENTISEFLLLLGIEGPLKKALRTRGFQWTKILEIKRAPKKYQKKLSEVVATQLKMPRDIVRHIASALNRADRYQEDDNAKKLLEQDFNNLSTVSALDKINKIVPNEESRVKEPADAVRFISEKIIELVDLFEDHPLESFDGFHRPLVIGDINRLGLYLSLYLKGKEKEKIGKVKLLDNQKVKE
jgi:ParB-like chromosome segregation protein Spo0J